MENSKQYEELQHTVKQLRELYDSKQKEGISDPLIIDQIGKLNKIIDELNAPKIPTKPMSRTKLLNTDGQTSNAIDSTTQNTIDYISSSRNNSPVSIADIISANLQSRSIIRKLAKVTQTTNDFYDVAIYNQPMKALWSDGVAVADVVDSFIMKQVKIFDLTLQPKATQRLLNDINNINEWLAEQASNSILLTENNAYINGDGISQPEGIFSTTKVGGQSIERIQTVSAGVVKLEDIMKLYYSLNDQYNGAFFMNSSTTQAIRTLKDSSTGQYLWSPGLLSGKADTLLGKDLYNINTIPNVSAGNSIIAYADLGSCYQIVDRKTINVQEDPYTNKPYVVFFVTKGIGASIIDPNGIKILTC